MAPKREFPSAVSGGGGGVLNERGGWLWGTFFECLFFNAFSDALFEASDPILEVLGFNFGHFGMFFAVFSYIRGFLKIALPCRRELKNQGPGVTEIAQTSNNKCIWLWTCFGKQFSRELIQFWCKTAPKGTQNWSLCQTWAELEPPIFTRGSTWLAQVVPNGAQSGSKGAQRLPKWS